MTDRIILTKDQAINLIGERKQVHTFANPGVGMMIGADHSRKSIIKTINDAKLIEIGGDMCKNMGHGLVIWGEADTRPLFVAVDKIELAELENSLSK